MRNFLVLEDDQGGAGSLAIVLFNEDVLLRYFGDVLKEFLNQLDIGLIGHSSNHEAPGLVLRVNELVKFHIPAMLASEAAAATLSLLLEVVKVFVFIEGNYA